jgi:transposase
LQESAQLLLAGRRNVVERLEVMAGPTGRRSWSEAVKARIVAESFEPGARVVDVARRHGVAPQQVTAWRRDARKGRLVLPVEDAAPFAALVVEEPPAAAPAPSAPSPSMIEIEAGGVVVRLAGDAPAARVAEIAAALRGCR